MEFVKVVRRSDLRNRHATLVRVDGEEIALWSVDGKLYAINNVCPHQHFSMLHKGFLDGINVTCPMHGWTYSLETGTTVSGEGRVRVFKVLVEVDDVLIEAPAPLW